MALPSRCASQTSEAADEILALGQQAVALPADVGRLVAAVVLSDLHGQTIAMDTDRSAELLRRLPET
jgi:hypothetical protein